MTGGDGHDRWALLKPQGIVGLTSLTLGLILFRLEGDCTVTLALELAVIAFLVLLNGWFAMSEMAIVSARKTRLAARAADGDRGAARAVILAENPARFLSSVQIGITLIGILAGAFSGATLTSQLAGWIAQTPVLAPAAEVLAIAIVVGAITYASVIFGELVPKHIALANPEGIAAAIARPMALVARLAAPVVWLLEHSSRLVLALLRVRDSEDSALTEEEMRAVIAEGTESGVIEPREQELISGVMRFGDRKVRAIMTPRSAMMTIDMTWGDDKIREVLRQSRHSRFPVYRGNPDDIIGAIQAKTMLNAMLDGQSPDIAALVEPMEVVHDNGPALRVLDILRDSHIHMALVVDEYGGVQGLVTATDVLAVIAGRPGDSGGDEPLVMREDGSWLVDGDAAVDLVAEHIGCRIMAGADADYATVAGFVLARSRTIPGTGDYFTWDGWRFEIVDMDSRRIDKILISRQNDPPGAE
jgi:putative hemolysin